MKQNKLVLIGLVLLAIIIASTYATYRWIHRQNTFPLASARPERACRIVPTQRKDILGGFDSPCIIEIGLISYSRTDDTVNDMPYLLSLIKSGSFDASINKTGKINASLAKLGIYYFDVAPGQEDRLVEYLIAHNRNSATGKNVIDFAQRVYDCIGDKCPTIGPNSNEN